MVPQFDIFRKKQGDYVWLEATMTLVNRGYLNEEDVWNEFGAWILI